MPNDKAIQHLAVNTGNMIASLNLEVAQLQANQEQQGQEIKQLKAQNQELRTRIANSARRNEVKQDQSTKILKVKN